MKKVLVPFLGAALALAMMSGCSHNSATAAKSPQPGMIDAKSAKPASAKPSKQVAVVEGRVKRATELIAFVDVKDDKDHKGRALEALRAKGGALGADAVIGVEFHEGKGEPAHYSGVAVKFKKHRKNGSSNAASRMIRDESPQPRAAKDPGAPPAPPATK